MCSWTKASIKENLQDYPKKKLSIKEIQEVFFEDKSHSTGLITIDGYQITSQTHKGTHPHETAKVSHIVECLKRMIRYKPKIKTALIYNYADLCFPSKACPQMPIFAICKEKGSQGILIPEAPLERTQREAKEQRDIPWEKKIDQAYFIGATTGIKISEENLFDLPRAQLVSLSKEYPNDLDAKFSILIPREFESEKAIDKFQKHFQIHPTRKQTDISLYRYALDIDGITNSWIRSRYILSSNSLSIKQETPYCQWFYKGIEKNKHYLETKRDFSNLITIIQKARDNPTQVQQIIRNANAFADEYLSFKGQLDYLYEAIEGYTRYFAIS